MHVVHREGRVVSFDSSKIVLAVEKAALRCRVTKLKKRYSSLDIIVCSLLADGYGSQEEEDRIRETIAKIRIEMKEIKAYLHSFKRALRYLYRLECGSVENYLLELLRRLSRSTAMRFSTDLCLLTVPTPPTVGTVSGSLSCGRIAYVGV